jgi:molybdate transport system substrate-binding protein
MRRLLLALCLLLPASAFAQPAPAGQAPAGQAQAGQAPAGQAQAGQAPTVFAAASLTDAMKDVAALWQKAGHPAPHLSFGASSTLAQQIQQGAPAAIFASADERWMDFLAKADLLAPGTRTDLLSNSLVLIAPADHPVHVAIGAGTDFAKLLGPSGRIATGDPAHVPVGLYAKAALTSLGLWDRLSPRIAATEDVRGALLLVERGEAPLGIVYATDAAVTSKVMIAGTFPASSHEPITYPFAVTRAGDTAQARALLAFMAGPQARAVFARRGFGVARP